MTIELTNEERETHLNMTADNRGVWIAYSDDPVMIRKLESVGAKLLRAERDGWGRHYELTANQVTLRKPPKSLSPEQRVVAAANLAAARQKQANATEK